MQLYQGDCLEIMKQIPDGSIDLVLADPPYGTTACKWDSIIPLEPMWEQLKRIVKPNAAIVMTASQPFTSKLIMSNIKAFKYEWVWDKAKHANAMIAKIQPLKIHENVIVFNSKRYFPIKTKGLPRVDNEAFIKNGDNFGGGTVKRKYENKEGLYNPKSIIKISNAAQNGKVHPTQKPVSLMEYMIKTYSNEGETVLDFTMGSGTTGVACANTGRKFIGIELDEHYFNIAKQRIEEAQRVLY